MRILLLLPPFTLEDRYGKRLGIAGPVLPPLGLAYIAAVLEREGHRVEILDAPALGMSAGGIADYVKGRGYNLIGISVQTPMYGRFLETLKAIEPVRGNAKVVAGGPHASIMPGKILEENPGLDYSVYGEGELTIAELANVIERGGDLARVRGIAWRGGGKVRVNPPRPFIRDIDSLPYPARHLLRMGRYRPAPSTYKRLPLMHMITTRGCPFQCVYCSARSIFGRIHRFHSPRRVAEEMESLVEEYGAREIFFLDDIFTLNRRWAGEVCREIVRRGLNRRVEWSCSARVDTVSRPLLLKMRGAGCWQIHYGVESGSQRLLDYIRKGITLQDSRNAIKWSREAGIQTRAYMMIGLPSETREETCKTIEFAKELNADYAKFSLTTPYPGTELFEIAKGRGEIKSLSWESYKTLGGFTGDERPYVPRGRTSRELKAFERIAYRRYYLRPGYVLERLKRARSLSELLVYLKGFLALL